MEQPTAIINPDRVSPEVDNRSIFFSVDKARVDLDQLIQLFNRNAFWAQDRCPTRMARAIERSSPVVTLWDGDRLIGFGRATSDGAYRAVIWDVVIDQDYRRQGLGGKLVETLISHPDVLGVERIYLFTTHQQGFYQRIGFVENTSTTLVLMGKTLEFLTPNGELTSPAPGED
jgi:ribosomal protein S18 acetylase RimI-like enzyme